MNDFAQKIANLSPQKLALLCVELQSALEAQRQQTTEPIAVIGLGCRMPGGGDDSAAFWRLLRDGVDCTREVPWDRWNPAEVYDSNPETAGRMYTNRGGFLDRVDGFDPAFFRMSPREAASLDPQQRLLLEVSWQAIEDAGLSPGKLVGSRTGVFVGIGVEDYARRQLKAGVQVDSYSGTGSAFCFASGRLSYFFGFQGPSIALDTACSSSLVTVHLACQSLRNRECDQALAGGVNLMLAPEASIFLSRSHALSSDGRCKTFDASADGYARSEGCGMLVLRRLKDAVASGDRILALIRGSAMNHDGPSSGLTVPNPQAQQVVIRQALKNAGVEPAEIGYLEAHGTGTALGDPIEVRALTEVFAGRSEPLWLGSVKTNIGHLETGAGVASLIKVILALHHEELPPHLHFQSSNPNLSLAGVPARLTVSRTPWARRERPRLAGVSSFGLSGTNAHIVLEEAPDANLREAPRDGKAYQLLLTARTPDTLLLVAGRWMNWLDSPAAQDLDLRDICYTAAVRRTRQRHQLVVTGATHAELSRTLAAYLAGAKPELAPNAILPREGRVVSLPPYPFSHQRCWFEEETARDFVLSRSQPCWLDDHRIYQTVLFPATGYLALAASAGAPAIRDLSIEQALIIPREGSITLRLTAKTDGSFRFHAGEAVYATGRIDFAERVRPDRSAVPESKYSDGAEYYQRLRNCGFDYGPAFQGIREMRRAGTEIWSRIELPAMLHDELLDWPLHPALLDSCMQSLGLAFDYLASESEAWLPVALDEFRVYAPRQSSVWCRVFPGSKPEKASLDLFDDAGRLVGEMTGLRLRRTRRDSLLLQEFGTSTAIPENLFYKHSWVRCPRPAADQQTPLRGTWMIVGGGESLAHALASRLEAKGASVEFAASDADFPGVNGVSGVVYLAALDSPDLNASCRGMLRLVKAISSVAISSPAIWIVTSGADEAKPILAPLWGIGRTLALEHPSLWGGLIDLDPALSPADQIALLASEIAVPDAERQLAFRSGSRFAARLVRTELNPSATAIDPNGTYLITGGTGALGQRVAASLKLWGAKHVVLASRHASIPVDVSREDEVVALLDRIARDLPPLKGIIHAAGVLDDALLAEQSWERFEAVLAPKIRGALFLDRHTRHLHLDFFVLFSAFSTMLGSPGQSAYVAANSFLNALAANRRTHGLPAISIGWGPFAEAGMSARLDQRHAVQRAALGISDIPLDQGMQILRRLLASNVAQVGVLPVDWERFAAAYEGPSRTLFAELGIGLDSGKSASYLLDLAHLAPGERREKLSSYLRSEIARQLGYPTGELPQLQDSLAELGFDSLLSLELRNRLSRGLGIEIPARVFFENEKLDGLVHALDRLLDREAQKAPTATNGHSELRRAPSPDETLAGIHALSETELEALLSELTAGGGAA